MMLYKYVSSSTLLRILETRKVYCGRISTFNDPFEGQVFQKDEDLFSSDKFIDELCRQVVEMDAFGEQATLDNSKPFNPITAFVALYQHKAFGDMSQSRFLGIFREYLGSRVLLSEPSDWACRVHGRLADYIHAFCLTTNRESLLMWAHYAENHKGAILGFEVAEVKSFLSEARPVIYSEGFPKSQKLEEIARLNLGRSLDMHKWMAATFLTKSVEWSYEAEWRVLVRYDLLDNTHLVWFPPQALREIVLGCRHSQDTYEQVVRIATADMQHLQVYVADIDRHTFSLNYHAVSM
jgi:Protein of unknown function (DUF2971)